MRTEKFKEIKDHFRIEVSLGEDVSDEAVRQFARIIESIVDEKPIYRVTAPNGKVSYHATASDISRFLYTKGIIGAQIANIHMAIRSNSHAYNHNIEKIKIERKFR